MRTIIACWWEYWYPDTETWERKPPPLRIGPGEWNDLPFAVEVISYDWRDAPAYHRYPV